VIRLAADENFNNNIVRGVRRRNPAVNILRVQDAGLTSAEDSEVLEWAAQEGRVLLSHDVQTLTHFAYERVRAELPMPGVFEVSNKLPIGVAIEEVLLLAEASLEGEWEGQVRYLPF
jgi:hypothetical protein